jgi:hypothetical protein
MRNDQSSQFNTGVFHSKGPLQSLVSRLDALLNRAPFLLTVVLLVAYTLFFQFPNVFEIEEDPHDHFSAILKISDSLTTQLEFEPGSHNEKKTLRPALPALVKTLSIGTNVGVYALFCVFNVLWIGFTLAFLRQETQDPSLSFWALATLCGVYVGGSGFLDTMGWGDSFAYALIAIALVWRRSWVVIPILTLAMLTDERAILSSCFIAWWTLLEKRDCDRWNLSLFRSCFFVFTAFISFLLVRICMHAVLGFESKSGMIGLKAYLSLDPGSVHAGLWSGFELGWWLIGLSVVVLMKLRPIMAWLACAGLFALLAGSLLVADVTKSLSYGFPFFLMGIVLLQRSRCFCPSRFRRLVMVTCLLCAIIPGPVVFGHYRFQSPFVLRVIPPILSHASSIGK